jgi:hypothetical protein
MEQNVLCAPPLLFDGQNRLIGYGGVREFSAATFNIRRERCSSTASSAAYRLSNQRLPQTAYYRFDFGSSGLRLSQSGCHAMSFLLVD